MLISAHDFHNNYYVFPGPVINTTNTPTWGHGWQAQKNVSAAQVTATGGTYSVAKPEPEESPKKNLKSKK